LNFIILKRLNFVLAVHAKILRTARSIPCSAIAAAFGKSPVVGIGVGRVAVAIKKSQESTGVFVSTPLGQGISSNPSPQMAETPFTA
jgi:hypothetical protein